MGSKRRELSQADIKTILELYAAFEPGAKSKVFDTTAFGYRQITVERPLQLSFTLTPEKVEAALATKAVAKLPEPDQTALRVILVGRGGAPLVGRVVSASERIETPTWTSRDQFVTDLRKVCKDARLTLAAPVLKALVGAIGEHDPDAELCRDAKGKVEPDPSLRDTERVPLAEEIEAYVAREVLPHVPNAWVDPAKTRIGYEIPFTRHFYVYTPPRPLEEIDAEIAQRIKRISELFEEVQG